MRWIVFCLGLFLLSAAGCGGGGVAKVSPFAGKWNASFWSNEYELRVARFEVDKRGRVSGACWLVIEPGLVRGEASGAFQTTGEGVLTLRYPGGWTENFVATATLSGDRLKLDLDSGLNPRVHLVCHPPADTATESGSYEGTFGLLGRLLPASLSLGAQGEMVGSFVENGRRIDFAGWLSNNGSMVGYTSDGVFDGGFTFETDSGGVLRTTLNFNWMQRRDDAGNFRQISGEAMRLVRQ